MKYFFVLGRNPKLSHAEVLSYLDTREISFTELVFEDTILILDLKETFDFEVNVFGGVISLGRLTFQGDEEAFNAYLTKEDLIPEDKFSYSIFGNADRTPLSEKFKHEKRKATFKPGSKRLSLQGGETINRAKTDYTFLLHKHKKAIYFGLVEQSFDPEEQQKRDMQKPIRREALAISPRLSRILINLAGLTEGQKLADPFCGIGAILLEGLAMNLTVYGRDKDSSAIKDAKQNLTWFIAEYGRAKRYKVEAGDSRDLPNENFDGIAGEGPLGKLLSHKAGKKEAQEIIADFEHRIIPILARLKTCVKQGGKIALTFPVVGDYHVNCKSVAKEAGVKLMAGPIHEYRDKQFVSRDFVVFE